jgi:hypothetical protein
MRYVNKKFGRYRRVRHNEEIAMVEGAGLKCDRRDAGIDGPTKIRPVSRIEWSLGGTRLSKPRRLGPALSSDQWSEELMQLDGLLFLKDKIVSSIWDGAE